MKNNCNYISRLVFRWVLFLIIFSSMAVNASTYGVSDIIKGAGKFYERTSRGTIALLKGKNELEKFNSGSLYKLKNQSELVFIVNHRNTTTSENTYLAVEVIRIFDPDTPIQEGVGMRRNIGWTRINDSKFSTDKNEDWNRKISLSDFGNIHAQESLGEADEKLSFKWHAQPSRDSESSWLEHDWWAEPTLGNDMEAILSAFSNRIHRNSKYHSSYRLYRFREMDKSNTQSPLYFKVRTHRCKALFIRTYSPISPASYDRYYYFEIE